MINYKLAVVVFLVSFAAAPAWSQANDIAAERSRVANERIRVEAERIAEEERRRAEAAAIEAQWATAPDEGRNSEQANAQQQNTAPPAADTPAAVASSATAPRTNKQTGRLGMSRMLEHLRVLGQLREASYVTEEEFERIKERILDGEL
ncbi:MAG: hypothetical protein KJP16_08945 [Gammaproteobacteria bacterium]|nr:hypothetical protein [Gammaproteobacteria bacterium]NNL50930.1 hypothetical protein [Woeseiaceae bacterium]